MQNKPEKKKIKLDISNIISGYVPGPGFDRRKHNQKMKLSNY